MARAEPNGQPTGRRAALAPGACPILSRERSAWRCRPAWVASARPRRSCNNQALAGVLRVSISAYSAGDPQVLDRVVASLQAAIFALRSSGACLGTDEHRGLVGLWRLPYPAGAGRLAPVMAASRALRAAHARASEGSLAFLQPVWVRFGLNAGWLAPGSGPGQAVPGMVDLAAGLARAAQPGCLLASPPIFAATRRLLDWVATSPAVARDEALPHPAYLLFQEKAPISHQALADMRRLPLVGREPELAALRAALEQASAGSLSWSASLQSLAAASPS